MLRRSNEATTPLTTLRWSLLTNRVIPNPVSLASFYQYYKNPRRLRRSFLILPSLILDFSPQKAPAYSKCLFFPDLTCLESFHFRIFIKQVLLRLFTFDWITSCLNVRSTTQLGMGRPLQPPVKQPTTLPYLQRPHQGVHQRSIRRSRLPK